MDDKKFESFLIAVKGKDMTDVLREQVVDTLRELLAGEFSAITETKFKIVIKAREDRALAAVSKVDGAVYVFINPEIHRDSLRGVLRHELCHVEADFADDCDPKFKAVARAHGADVCQV